MSIRTQGKLAPCWALMCTTRGNTAVDADNLEDMMEVDPSGNDMHK